MMSKRAPSPSARRSPAVCTCLAVALGVALGGGLAGCGGEGDRADDPIVARVDGAAVHQSAVDEAVAAGGMAGVELSAERAREQLIDEQVVAAEADRLGVRVSDADVAARIDEVAAQVGGREALAAALQKEGLTLEAYGERVAAALLVERLAVARFTDVKASDKEARRYYRKQRDDEFVRPARLDLGDITLKTEAQALDVRRRILAGQSFASAARQFSSDPQSRDDGGRLGWVLADSIPPPLAEELARLRPGRIARPVKVMGAWHVAKLYGRRPEKRFTYPEVRRAIHKKLTRERRLAAVREWLTEARAGADIEIVD